MNAAAQAARDAQARAELKRHWKRSLAFGLLTAGAGTVAILAPIVATVTIALLIGWIFMIAGAFEVFGAVGTYHGRRLALSLGLAALAIAAGLWLVSQPLDGTLTLTVVLAIALIAIGGFQLAAALMLPVERRWHTVASGVITLTVGTLIWAKLPESSAWAIGLLAGIHFVVRGLRLAWLALAARRA